MHHAKVLQTLHVAESVEQVIYLWNSQVASRQRPFSDVVFFDDRTQLAHDLSQNNIGEIHLLDMIAISKVLKESINRFFATAFEDVTSIHEELFKVSAPLGEMTQPAELFAATWKVVAIYYAISRRYFCRVRRLMNKDADVKEQHYRPSVTGESTDYLRYPSCP